MVISVLSIVVLVLILILVQTIFDKLLNTCDHNKYDDYEKNV